MIVVITLFVYPLLGCCDRLVLADNRGPAWTTELISKPVRFVSSDIVLHSLT